ncbi:hypothetical protein [Staphylococcus massiliensis]|uniref:hypothetical protein n=1 Tax=Staphylococcus massiliensis TaxID=555791 RepID=UPI00037E05B9|nr:hypothetical protein [Staphylococcus massiliensis]MCG3398797.1 hypothetical protein [Staphylococcus massiliensis]MCG3401358.1 hypothetical protein [Staphylococcus massiliensis]MCG3411860.1 hypothetical protein [Staphylococcus massiliensis]
MKEFYVVIFIILTVLAALLLLLNQVLNQPLIFIIAITIFIIAVVSQFVYLIKTYDSK